MKEPGRELDAEIAEKVMGTAAYAWVIEGASRSEAFPNKESAEKAHPVLAQWYRMGPLVLDGSVPCYSTDIAAAWLVVEKLQEKGQDLALVSGDEWANVKMVANAPGVFQWGAVFDTEGARPYSLAPTAPHAICLAALAAVGEG